MRSELILEPRDLRRWWEHVLESEPPPGGMRGVWFGLLEVDPIFDVAPPDWARSEDLVGVRLYVYGLDAFDPGDADSGWWAVHWSGTERRRPCWWPRSRLVQPRAWSAIAAYDWREVLEAGLAFVHDLAPWRDLPGLEVAGAGFDNGDPYVVWTPEPLLDDAPIWSRMRRASDGVVG